MSQWQKIETAPKDGTPILTYREGGHMTVAAWADGTSWIDGPWVGWRSIEGVFISNVTHWQSLPEPPHDN